MCRSIGRSGVTDGCSPSATQTGFPDLPILEVSLRTGIRVREFGNNDRKQMMSDREKYKRAVAGDIAYNMMRHVARGGRCRTHRWSDQSRLRHRETYPRHRFAILQPIYSKPQLI